MKIINCFSFYNEVQMLEYKLHLLNDYVDKFVLVESRHTFVGNKTEPVFEKIKNNEIFSKYKDKIHHIIIDEYPYVMPNINYDSKQQWENEFFHRNYMSESFKTLELDDEDIIISGDLDEIVNPDVLRKIKNGETRINDLYSLEMKNFYFNLMLCTDNCRRCKIYDYGTFKKMNMTIHEIRMRIDPLIITDGGWHLSWFGDKDFCKTKIESFSHVELNKGDTGNVNYIKNIIFNNNNYSENIPPPCQEVLPPYYEPFYDIFFKNTLV